MKENKLKSIHPELNTILSAKLGGALDIDSSDYSHKVA